MKNINKELESLSYLRNLIEVYEEVASIRMRKVKTSVLLNRTYLKGLTSVFNQVKYSYKKELASHSDSSTGATAVRKTNGKSVSVLLSANTGLYGNVIINTYEKFLGDIRDNNDDIVIVGSIGEQLYKASNISKSRPLKTFNLSDSSADSIGMEKLLDHLLSYETITVYHGLFRDLLVQSPGVTSISGDLLEKNVDEVVVDAKYLFEPSLVGVVSVFENEILGTIFEHTVHESNLSKYASRMINLDKAVSRIETDIKEKILKNKKLEHRVKNNKRLHTLIYSSI